MFKLLWFSVIILIISMVGCGNQSGSDGSDESGAERSARYDSIQESELDSLKSLMHDTSEAAFDTVSVKE